jgi:hypothetical protein
LDLAGVQVPVARWAARFAELPARREVGETAHWFLQNTLRRELRTAPRLANADDGLVQLIA